MTQYHLHEAILELPPQLKDKTVQMFTLSDDGINEFNLVISRIDIPAQETLDCFTERLLDDLQATRSGFEFKSCTKRQFGDSPATEISYKWCKDGVFLHQRQAITLVQSHLPAHRQALLLTATYLMESNETWNQAFDRLLDSVQLRHPLLHAAEETLPAFAVAEPLVEPPTPPQAMPHVFALSTHRKTLHVYRNEEEACAQVNPIEVEDGLWNFYASDGNALEAMFVHPNTGKVWRIGGKYCLRSARSNAPPLLSRLHQVLRIKGVQPFDTLSAVQAHLEQQAAAGPIAIPAQTD